uniref:GAF domain-containing protein n=1 Tax=Chromera velia CCMP2878 TaxID=1169474 RepID=A0A0G4I8I7_9ALVE|eukprot:Cvel_11875.t1-p1 / transcript=Cvel_11875.t1 / gene=Cvel_11875 / organism=Chromera_velia_CCMP2878 / gene_product=hypothetical protein / transcript_product=hypothetical protein / location=Cvel_scaffold758:39779-55249(+) / protein_length=2290 / sequence_SO=supercontig / SO=protein_coding / is_pseudo=false
MTTPSSWGSPRKSEAEKRYSSIAAVFDCLDKEIADLSQMNEWTPDDLMRADYFRLRMKRVSANLHKLLQKLPGPDGEYHFKERVDRYGDNFDVKASGSAVAAGESKGSAREGEFEKLAERLEETEKLLRQKDEELSALKGQRATDTVAPAESAPADASARVVEDSGDFLPFPSGDDDVHAVGEAERRGLDLFRNVNLRHSPPSPPSPGSRQDGGGADDLSAILMTVSSEISLPRVTSLCESSCRDLIRKALEELRQKHIAAARQQLKSPGRRAGGEASGATGEGRPRSTSPSVGAGGSRTGAVTPGGEGNEEDWEEVGEGEKDGESDAEGLKAGGGSPLLGGGGKGKLHEGEGGGRSAGGDLLSQISVQAEVFAWDASFGRLKRCLEDGNAEFLDLRDDKAASQCLSGCKVVTRRRLERRHLVGTDSSSSADPSQSSVLAASSSSATHVKDGGISLYLRNKGGEDFKETVDILTYSIWYPLVGRRGVHEQDEYAGMWQNPDDEDDPSMSADPDSRDLAEEEESEGPIGAVRMTITAAKGLLLGLMQAASFTHRFQHHFSMLLTQATVYPLRDSDNVACHVALTAEVLQVDDMEDSDRFRAEFDESYEVRNLMALPIFVSPRSVGGGSNRRRKGSSAFVTQRTVTLDVDGGSPNDKDPASKSGRSLGFSGTTAAGRSAVLGSSRADNTGKGLESLLGVLVLANKNRGYFDHDDRKKAEGFLRMISSAFSLSLLWRDNTKSLEALANQRDRLSSSVRDIERFREKAQKIVELLREVSAFADARTILSQFVEGCPAALGISDCSFVAVNKEMVMAESVVPRNVGAIGRAITTDKPVHVVQPASFPYCHLPSDLPASLDPQQVSEALYVPFYSSLVIASSETINSIIPLRNLTDSAPHRANKNRAFKTDGDGQGAEARRSRDGWEPLPSGVSMEKPANALLVGVLRFTLTNDNDTQLDAYFMQQLLSVVAMLQHLCDTGFAVQQQQFGRVEHRDILQSLGVKSLIKAVISDVRKRLNCARAYLLIADDRHGELWTLLPPRFDAKVAVPISSRVIEGHGFDLLDETNIVGISASAGVALKHATRQMAAARAGRDFQLITHASACLLQCRHFHEFYARTCAFAERLSGFVRADCFLINDTEDAFVSLQRTPGGGSAPGYSPVAHAAARGSKRREAHKISAQDGKAGLGDLNGGIETEGEPDPWSLNLSAARWGLPRVEIYKRGMDASMDAALQGRVVFVDVPGGAGGKNAGDSLGERGGPSNPRKSLAAALGATKKEDDPSSPGLNMNSQEGGAGNVVPLLYLPLAGVGGRVVGLLRFSDFPQRKRRDAAEISSLKHFACVVAEVAKWTRQLHARPPLLPQSATLNLQQLRLVGTGATGVPGGLPASFLFSNAGSGLQNAQTLDPFVSRNRLLLVVKADGKLDRFSGSIRAVLGKTDSVLRVAPCWGWMPSNDTWTTLMKWLFKPQTAEMSLEQIASSPLRKANASSTQNVISNSPGLPTAPGAQGGPSLQHLMGQSGGPAKPTLATPLPHSLMVKDFHWLCKSRICTCDLTILPEMTNDNSHFSSLYIIFSSITVMRGTLICPISLGKPISLDREGSPAYRCAQEAACLEAASGAAGSKNQKTSVQTYAARLQVRQAAVKSNRQISSLIPTPPPPEAPLATPDSQRPGSPGSNTGPAPFRYTPDSDKDRERNAQQNLHVQNIFLLGVAVLSDSHNTNPLDPNRFSPEGNVASVRPSKKDHGDQWDFPPLFEKRPNRQGTGQLVNPSADPNSLSPQPSNSRGLGPEGTGSEFAFVTVLMKVLETITKFGGQAYSVDVDSHEVHAVFWNHVDCLSCGCVCDQELGPTVDDCGFDLVVAAMHVRMPLEPLPAPLPFSVDRLHTLITQRKEPDGPPGADQAEPSPLQGRMWRKVMARNEKGAKGPTDADDLEDGEKGDRFPDAQGVMSVSASSNTAMRTLLRRIAAYTFRGFFIAAFPEIFDHDFAVVPVELIPSHEASASSPTPLGGGASGASGGGGGGLLPSISRGAGNGGGGGGGQGHEGRGLHGEEARRFLNGGNAEGHRGVVQVQNVLGRLSDLSPSITERIGRVHVAFRALLSRDPASLLCSLQECLSLVEEGIEDEGLSLLVTPQLMMTIKRILRLLLTRDLPAMAAPSSLQVSPVMPQAGLDSPPISPRPDGHGHGDNGGSSGGTPVTLATWDGVWEGPEPQTFELQELLLHLGPGLFQQQHPWTRELMEAALDLVATIELLAQKAGADIEQDLVKQAEADQAAAAGPGGMGPKGQSPSALSRGSPSRRSI